MGTANVHLESIRSLLESCDLLWQTVICSTSLVLSISRSRQTGGFLLLPPFANHIQFHGNTWLDYQYGIQVPVIKFTTMTWQFTSLFSHNILASYLATMADFAPPRPRWDRL